jgi:hypothetical protein
MKAKFVRMFLILWPCVTSLCLAASPPIFAQEPKRQGKTPDIQGTWNLVSWERNGKDQKPQRVRLFITESQIYSEGMPLPDDKGLESWHYELGPGDKPSTGVMNLDGLQGRELVPGLCALDGATLRIVLGRVTATQGLPLKEVKVDRPKEFATRPGSDQLLLVLKRAAAADDPISLLRKLGGSPTITLGDIHLGSEQAKQARNEDLAIIKKYPLIHALELRGCPITDAGLVHLKDMANLQYLTLADMPVTDKGLVHLEGLPKLTDFTVNCAKISGAGLKHLTGITSLALEGSAFTDADLAHLEGLTKLECLNLRKTAITDAGLVHLKRLINLDRLFLENTKVTDAGLVHLQGLTKLRNLRLRGTKVTEKGVRALQAALPDLEEIVR